MSVTIKLSGETDELRAWGQQTQIITQRMDEQGPTVQNKELQSIPCNKQAIKEKNMKKKAYIYKGITLL